MASIALEVAEQLIGLGLKGVSAATVASRITRAVGQGIGLAAAAAQVYNNLSGNDISDESRERINTFIQNQVSSSMERGGSGGVVGGGLSDSKADEFEDIPLLPGRGSTMRNRLNRQGRRPIVQEESSSSSSSYVPNQPIRLPRPLRNPKNAASIIGAVAGAIGTVVVGTTSPDPERVTPSDPISNPTETIKKPINLPNPSMGYDSGPSILHNGESGDPVYDNGIRHNYFLPRKGYFTYANFASHADQALFRTLNGTSGFA